MRRLEARFYFRRQEFTQSVIRWNALIVSNLMQSGLILNIVATILLSNILCKERGICGIRWISVLEGSHHVRGEAGRKGGLASI
jgi:hypothetical protein